ncbi:MAG: hypothetical protein HRU04_08715 [Oceanospirillaceae bacterium]|nr:hypothetical protein [Oceanospirillaceae bacterium]
MNDIKEPESYGVTPTLYSQWRSPRFGKKNPDRIESIVWLWLVRSGLSAYEANEKMDGPSSLVKGASWCFDRMGQSVTELPDGRKIFIGGEHEDHYDPDFCIYNDVVVENTDGSIDIYSYPKENFPPTDFHSATFLDNKIIIIGSLGYTDDRAIGNTQVYLLDTTSFEIHNVNTTGSSPGWIHDQEASLEFDKSRIIIKKGKVYIGNDSPLRENIDDWELDLKEWQWKPITNRPWVRWEITRSDQKMIHLWDIRQALYSLETNKTENYDKELANLELQLGHLPDVNLIKELYSPGVPHIVLPEIEDEYNLFRISISGIVIRFVEDMDIIQVTVEGILPNNLIECIKKDTLDKITALENAPCELVSY